MEDKPLGRKRVLRLEFDCMDSFSFDELSGSDEPDMLNNIKDHFVSYLGDGDYSITFRTKKVDKVLFKESMATLKRTLQESRIKMSRKAMKEQVMAEMLPYAPIVRSKADFHVEGNGVYLLGLHKKVFSVLFCNPIPSTPVFDGLNALWEHCGNPCNNVTITHFDEDWTRICKEDSTEVAVTAVAQGGKVQKFVDVFSYSLCEGRLLVAGEFESYSDIDTVLDNAEALLGGDNV